MFSCIFAGEKSRKTIRLGKDFGNYYSKTGIREHVDIGHYPQACCYG